MKTINYCQSLGFYGTCRNQLRMPITFKKNGDIATATPGSECREVYANQVARVIRGEHDGFEGKARAARLMRNARVLFVNTDAAKSRIDACIPVLNMLEDKVGFSRTKAVSVNTADRPNYKNYMFVGDCNWYKSTVLISLYLLLLRLFINAGNVYKFRAMTSLEDFYSFIKNDPIFDNIKDAPLGHYFDSKRVADLHTVYHTHENWELLLSNIDKLLPKSHTWAKRFTGTYVCKPEVSHRTSFGTQGIKALFRNQCYLKISDKYNELIS